MLRLLPIRLPDNTTSRTLLAGVPSINSINTDAQSLGLIGQDTPELRKAPIGQLPVHVAALVAFDLAQVFQNNHVYVTTAAQDGVDGAMENIGPEAVLTSAETLQFLTGRRCAFGFKFSPSFLQSSRAEVQLPCRIEVILAGNGYLPNSLVNAHDLVALPERRRVFRHRNFQEPPFLPMDKFSPAYLPGAVKKLGLVGGQPIVNSNPIPRSGESAVVGGYLGRSSIVANSRLPEYRLGLVSLFSSGYGAASQKHTGHDPSRTDDMVGFHAGVFFPHRVVHKVVEWIKGKAAMLPCHVTNVVQQDSVVDGGLHESSVVV